MTIATISGSGPDRRPTRDGTARRPSCRRATGRALPPADDAAPDRTASQTALPEASHG